MIVRRELAVNFVHTTPDYDQYESLPEWARQTLAAHRRDRREHAYSFDQFAGADTHDPYWNAAMREMLLTGYMHNHMRMYWGKKVLEWSPSPEEGYATLLRLNNKFFLDGRDANSYANVGWVFGLHDRLLAGAADLRQGPLDDRFRPPPQDRHRRLCPEDLSSFRLSAAPQDLCRAPRAFGHCFELGPADRGVADPRAETAIGAGQHVLAADQLGVAHQALGDQIGMLDEVGAVADDARDQGGAFRQFHLLEDPPLVLMARVRGLDRIAPGAHPEDQIDDVPERDVVVVRARESCPSTHAI